MAQADRRYETEEGWALATYDGSTWQVAAHAFEDDRDVDHRVVVEAYRDEAGFRGRDWRAEGLAASDLGQFNPLGMDDQWPSLKAVAEAAIHLACQRVALDHSRETWQAFTLARATAPEAVTVEHAQQGGPLSDDAWLHFRTEHEPARAEAKGSAGVQRMDRDHWGVWGWNPETRQTYFDSTYQTADAAIERALATLIPTPEPSGAEAVGINPSGTLCVECACGWGRIVLDGETAEQARAAHVGTDIHRNWQREVDRLVADGYTVGEAEAAIEHDAGDHDEESDPGCPRCADTHDPEEDTVTTQTIDLTPGNAEQANILTYLSRAFAEQAMLPNAYGAIRSVIDLARCLQANAPDVLQGVMDELDRMEANWGPDTPAGKAAAKRARRDGDDW